MFQFILFWGLILQPTINSTVMRSEHEQHELSYLALGDSYTIGESVADTERFPMQTVELLRRKGLSVQQPRIVATTGWTTDELEAGIVLAGIEPTYDLVTLLIGVNDQYRGRSVQEYEPAFEKLLRAAIAFAGGERNHVFVLSIPDWGVTPFAEGRDRQQIAFEIDAYNSVNRRIAQKEGVAYLDITPGTRLATSDPSLVAGDGLHPSGKEYTAWAQQLAPMILKVMQR